MCNPLLQTCPQYCHPNVELPLLTRNPPQRWRHCLQHSKVCSMQCHYTRVHLTVYRVWEVCLCMCVHLHGLVCLRGLPQVYTNSLHTEHSYNSTQLCDSNNTYTLVSIPPQMDTPPLTLTPPPPYKPLRNLLSQMLLLTGP